MRWLLQLLLLLLTACSDGQTFGDRSAAAAPPEIALTGRVTDAANLLEPGQEASLSRQLEHLERTTGHQMVVVSAPTLGGRDIADFTRDLGNAWGIGRAGQDDGVILLVAPIEREVRIAVGRGLEDELTDDLCMRILDERVLPRFREGDFPGGIDAGVRALIDQLTSSTGQSR